MSVAVPGGVLDRAAVGRAVALALVDREALVEPARRAWYGFFDAVSKTRWTNSCGIRTATSESSIWSGGISPSSVRILA